MLHSVTVEMIIDSDPETIWDYATKPEHWDAANPLSHLGLEYERETPETGTGLRQKEKIGNTLIVMKGHFLHVERPNLLVWTGIAYVHLLGGFLIPKIAVSGVITLDKTEKGTQIRHTFSMDFSDSLFGKLMHWLFLKAWDGERSLKDHLHRETWYFKEKLDGFMRG